MVVHHHRVQVGRRAVAAEDDHVVELGIGDPDGALDQVGDHRLALAWRLEADRGLHARRGLGRVTVAPAPVVAGRAALGQGALAHLLQLLGGAVAAIGAAGPEQRHRHLGMAGRAGKLEHGRLVGAEAEPVQALQDQPRVFVGAAGAVGILDPQQEFAAVMAAEQVVEEGGAGAADVQRPGGAGREARADGHGGAASSMALAVCRGWAGRLGGCRSPSRCPACGPRRA